MLGGGGAASRERGPGDEVGDPGANQHARLAAVQGRDLGTGQDARVALLDHEIEGDLECLGLAPDIVPPGKSLDERQLVRERAGSRRRGIALDHDELLPVQQVPVDPQALRLVGRDLDHAGLEHHLLGRHVHDLDDALDLGDHPGAGDDDQPVAPAIDLDVGRQALQRGLDVDRVGELEVHDVGGESGLRLERARVRDQDRVPDPLVGEAGGPHHQVDGLVHRDGLHVDREPPSGHARPGDDVEVALLCQDLEDAREVGVLGVQGDELRVRGPRARARKGQRPEQDRQGQAAAGESVHS